MKTVLSIAGSDPIGGAGIQADIKTMTVCGVHAMSVITAITAQNTMGVKSVHAVEPEILEEQIDAVFEDIMPDAVKIGMLPTAEAAKTVTESMLKYRPKHIVADPVLISSSGKVLAEPEALLCMLDLFPICELITPNIPEAEKLCGRRIISISDMESAARSLSRGMHTSILIKGGHLDSREAKDLLCMIRQKNEIEREEGIDECGGGHTQEMLWYRERRLSGMDAHGTGCVLSSAIASNLAIGLPLAEAVREGKKYTTSAMAAGWMPGNGQALLNHMPCREMMLSAERWC